MMTKPAVFLLAAFAAMSSVANADGNLESGFMNPPTQAKPHTWWHWMNGNVSRDGITRDLEAIADMGIGGINLFNVSCDIPAGTVDYMSREWLDLVKHAASEAERLGLEMGIQNCAGWATTGGPWIKPEDNMMELVHTTAEVVGGEQVAIKLEQPETRLGYYRDVAIVAYPSRPDLKEVYKWQPSTLQATCRSGKQPDLVNRAGPGIGVDRVVELTTQVGPDGSLKWEAPAGNWTVLRLGFTPRGNHNHPSPESGQGLEINKLKRRGVDAHWQGGIQPILDHLGELAPRSLSNLVIDSYEAGNHMWSPDMREEFLKRRGYDMMPYLPAMIGRPVGSVHMTERFFWDYRRTVSELVVENYYGYFTELANRHGMICSIEPYRGPFESMAVAAKPDVPVAEFFSDMTYGRGFLKMTSSAAHLYDRGVAPSEAFTCGGSKGGWRNHPATLKAAGDFAWTEGINRFVFHRFAHQPWDDKVPGMTMGPYGIHFEPTNTWWNPGRAWVEYITRSQFLLQQGIYVADALCFVGETSPNTRREAPELKAAGYDHHNCGTDMVYDLESEGGDIVTPTGKRYRMLILPDRVPYMTLKLATKIQELVREGGAVWAPKPTHSPTLAGFPDSEQQMRSIVDEVWGDCDGEDVTSNRYGKGMIFSGIAPAEAMAQWKVAPDLAQDTDVQILHWIHRKTDREDIYFISNQAEEQV
ncbi:MAG: glycosyl hydrolase, partial [Haloferula sp.]